MASVGRTGRGPWLAVALVVALAGCAGDPGRTPLPASPTGDRGQDFLAMGDRAAAAGELTTAAAFYQQAAGRMGDNVVALTRLGEVYLRDRRWTEAADVFARALRLDGSQLGARRGYARALIAMGQPASALAHLEEVLRVTPDDVRALNLEAVAQDMVGQPDEAAATYRRALALAPGDPRLEANLALSRALAGDHGTAIPMLERLAARPDATPRVRQNLAVAYALAGDLAAARRTGLLDLDPASVERNIAFVVQLRDGERSEAARALLSANGEAAGRGEPGGARRARAPATEADAPRPLVPGAGAAQAAGAAEGPTSRSEARTARTDGTVAASTEPPAAAAVPIEAAAPRQLAEDAPAQDPPAAVPPEPTPAAIVPTTDAAPAAIADDADPLPSLAAAAGPPIAAGKRDALPVAPIVLAIADADADGGATDAATAPAARHVRTPLEEPSRDLVSAAADTTAGRAGTTAEPVPAAGDARFPAQLPAAPIVLPDMAAAATPAGAEEPPPGAAAVDTDAAPAALAGPLAGTGVDPAAGAAATTASWLVSLGTFSDAGAALAEWRSLKARHGDVLSGLTRLGQGSEGAQTLIAGPVPDEATADSLCRRLAARGVSCRTQRI